MKISVVIPMYNSRETIVDTLNSVINQTKFDYISEIILVNDGSTDDSLDIVKKYAADNSCFNLIILNKSNSGVSAARNIGIKVATGSWIALLDSDDEWLPNKLETQINLLNNYSEIDFLGGPFDKTELKILTKKISYLYKANIIDLCLKNFPQPSTVIFRKTIFDTIGGFDEKQRYAEDGNYFLKICYYFNFYYYPELLIVYDKGKRGFGMRGLSSNLLEMYKGNIKNITELKKMRIIGFYFFYFLRFFYWLKYLRRIVISKVFLVNQRKYENEND